jgi:hypothetical protein
MHHARVHEHLLNVAADVAPAPTPGANVQLPGAGDDADQRTALTATADSGDSGPSAGVIAGAVIGTLLGVGVIVGGVVYVIKRRGKSGFQPM